MLLAMYCKWFCCWTLDKCKRSLYPRFCIPRYSVSREVPRSILKYKTVLGTLDATPKVPWHTGLTRGKHQSSWHHFLWAHLRYPHSWLWVARNPSDLVLDHHHTDPRWWDGEPCRRVPSLKYLSPDCTSVPNTSVSPPTGIVGSVFSYTQKNGLCRGVVMS